MNDKRRYARITLETRTRIVRAFEQGEDWQLVCKMNGVKYKTAYSWLHADIISYEQKRRGGQRKPILNEVEIDEIIEWVAADPTITLNLLKLRTKAEFDKDVSITTISRCLDGRFFTLKKLSYLPTGMNTPENKGRRANFVRELNRFVDCGKTICWIDETNFNLFCTRTMGRSLKGSKACITVCNSRGRNVHLIGAMTMDGLVAHSLRRGSYRSDDCVQWLRTVMDKLKERIPTSSIVMVIDNAPCHSRLECLFTESEYEGASLLRLAPYSPMLNPIEHVWSMVKSEVKHRLQTEHAVIVNGDPEKRMNQQDWRLGRMEAIVTTAVNKVTRANCEGFVRHCQSYHADALEEKDMGHS